jgi:hypothetical protein
LGVAYTLGRIEMIKRTRNNEVAIRYKTLPMLVPMKRMLLSPPCLERGTISHMYIYVIIEVLYI